MKDLILTKTSVGMHEFDHCNIIFLREEWLRKNKNTNILLINLLLREIRNFFVKGQILIKWSHTWF